MTDPTYNAVLSKLGVEYAPPSKPRSQMPPLTPTLHYGDGEGVPVLERSREVVSVVIGRDGRRVRRTTTYHQVR